MATRGTLLRAGVVVAALALLIGRWLATTGASQLWADSLGAGDAAGLILRTRVFLWTAAFAFSLLLHLGNLYLVYRSIGSVHVPRRVGNLEIVEAVPKRYLVAGIYSLGVIVAIALSLGADDWWFPYLLESLERPFGLEEPVLGRDAGFYVFQLPWLRTLHSFALLQAGVALAMAVVLYSAVGAMSWKNRSLQITDPARNHVAVLLSAFALSLTWGYRLEPLELVGGLGRVPYDTILVDYRIPGVAFLTGASLYVAAASALWIWYRRSVILAVSWIFLAGSSFVVHYVLPGLGAASRGPDERSAPLLTEAATLLQRMAYGLPSDTASGGRDIEGPTQVERLPVWDAFAVTLALNRHSDSRPGERFYRSSLDLYAAANGEPVPVYLAVEEVDLSEAQAAGVELAWDDIHLGEYRYGDGVVAVAAHRAAPGGGLLFIPDIANPDSVVTEMVFAQGQSTRVLFGPEEHEHAVVRRDEQPVAGVAAGGVLRRLALAWELQDLRLLGGSVNSTDRIIWLRAVDHRLRRYAPFARFTEPHPAIIDGRLVWLSVGMVAAEAFPLSPEVEVEGQTVRYLRPGFIGVVDGETGATGVYLVSEADPLSEAWAERFPMLVRSAEELDPALAEHVRYPVQLIRYQARMASRLRRTREAAPLWLPGENEPASYAWSGPSRGDEAFRLRVSSPLEEGDPPALVGFVEGSIVNRRPVIRMIRGGLYELSPGESRIAEQLATARSGVAGVTGALRMVPLGNGVLAYQSTYSAGGTSGEPPRLAEVVAHWQAAVAGGSDLTAAFVRMAGSEAAAGGAGSLSEIREWFRRLDRAREEGDWLEFGRAYRELERLLLGRPAAR